MCSSTTCRNTGRGVWAAVAGLAVAHGVVLYAVRVPDRIAPAGIMLTPLAAADWLLMYLALTWWMRGSPRR